MSRFKRIKNKSNKKSSVSIDEKIAALNKELEKTGMLSEKMTTSNVYSTSELVPYDPGGQFPVPDPTGVTGSGFTQPVSGDPDDPSNWPDAYTNNSWMYNPNEIEGESNRPIVATMDQGVLAAYAAANPGDNSYPMGGAGIVFGDIGFGTGVGFAKNGFYKGVLSPGLFGNGSTKIVPPGSPYGAPFFGLFGMYLASIEKANVIMAMSGAYAAAGGYNPSNAMQIQLWRNHNLFHDGPYNNYSGKKFQDDTGLYVLQTFYLHNRSSNTYHVNPTPEHQTNVQIRGTEDDPIYPGPIASLFGLGARAFEWLKGKANKGKEEKDYEKNRRNNRPDPKMETGASESPEDPINLLSPTEFDDRQKSQQSSQIPEELMKKAQQSKQDIYDGKSDIKPTTTFENIINNGGLIPMAAEALKNTFESYKSGELGTRILSTLPEKGIITGLTTYEKLDYTMDGIDKAVTGLNNLLDKVVPDATQKKVDSAINSILDGFIDNYVEPNIGDKSVASNLLQSYDDFMNSNDKSPVNITSNLSKEDVNAIKSLVTDEIQELKSNYLSSNNPEERERLKNEIESKLNSGIQSLSKGEKEASLGNAFGPGGTSVDINTFIEENKLKFNDNYAFRPDPNLERNKTSMTIAQLTGTSIDMVPMEGGINNILAPLAAKFLLRPPDDGTNRTYVENIEDAPSMPFFSEIDLNSDENPGFEPDPEKEGIKGAIKTTGKLIQSGIKGLFDKAKELFDKDLDTSKDASKDASKKSSTKTSNEKYSAKDDPYSEENYKENLPSWFTLTGRSSDGRIFGYNFSGAYGELKPGSGLGSGETYTGQPESGYGTKGFDPKTRTGGTSWSMDYDPKPVDSSKPTTPSKPVDPSKPTTPSKPVDPSKPTTPSKPEPDPFANEIKPNLGGKDGDKLALGGVNYDLYNWYVKTYGAGAAGWYHNNPGSDPSNNPFLRPGSYVPKAQKNGKSSTMVAHYQTKGKLLREAVKLGHFEPEQLNVNIEDLRKGIMPEYPKQPPAEMIDGYHEKSRIRPKNAKNEEPYLKIDRTDLIRSHRLKKSEADEMMNTINMINDYIRDNPADFIHAQMRYPVDDPRLAELNWKMDQMLDAGEEYLDSNFKVNDKLFKRAVDRTKNNIKLTDPEYVQQNYDELRGTTQGKVINPKPRDIKLRSKLKKHLPQYESKSFFKHVDSKDFKKISERKEEQKRLKLANETILNNVTKERQKYIDGEMLKQKSDWRKDISE